MKRGEMSFLILITLVVCGSYVLSAPGAAREALAAQAATPSSTKNQEPAYKLCPPQSATERYSSNKPIYPNKYKVPDPVRGGFITITNLYGKSCSTMNTELRIYVRSACRGPWDCRAIEYVDESGKIHPVTNDRFNSSPPVPCSGGGLIISTACGADTPPKIEPTQMQTPPTTQGNEIINAFNPQTDPAVPAQQQSPRTGQPVTSPATSVPSPAPVVPPAPPGSTAGLSAPDNSYTPSSPSQTYSTYSIPPQQETFPSTYAQQPRTQENRVQSTMGTFTPSLAPLLFNSVLPSSLSPLRTFAQLLFTPIIPVDKPGASAPSRDPATGTKVVVYELVLPPPPGSSIEEFLAFEKRRESAERSRISNGADAVDVTSNLATTLDTPERAFLSESDEGTATKGGGAASRSSTSSRQWVQSTVVDVGVPVDITDAASYRSTFAYESGDWTLLRRGTVKNKLALAEAESGYAAIAAQIGALQEARAANLCGEECDASLASLQNQLSIWQSDIDEFGAIVLNDEAPHPLYPPPTVAQFHRAAESFAGQAYLVTFSRSAAEAPTAVSVSEQEAMPEVPQSKSEAVVTRVIQSIWNFLKSIFLPPTTESAKPRARCSLFASLFGKCK